MSSENASTDWLDEISWSDQQLVPAIAQDCNSHRILMLGWMNREALLETSISGQAVYWSRSRHRLWRKGESSGHFQQVQEIRLDCDADVVTLLIDQTGGIACHTGRASCFYRVLKDDHWLVVDPVIQDPKEIYTDPEETHTDE